MYFFTIVLSFFSNFQTLKVKQKREKWTRPETPPHCGLSPSIFFFFFFFFTSLTGILCVISLQFIGFSLNKHSIEIWNINTHPGEKCSSGAQISQGGGGGVPLIWAMHKFKQFFYVCAPSSGWGNFYIHGVSN